MIPFAHIVHVVVPIHSVKQGESLLNEIWTKIHGLIFPLPVLTLVLVGIGLAGLFVIWLVVGKGFNSHAGREEVRRAYRRKLAQEMAKQDAIEVAHGEKKRRWWYIW